MTEATTESKHQAGVKARLVWSKPVEETARTICQFNTISSDTQFVKRADIVLDSSTDRQTVIQAIPIAEHLDKWCASEESVYMFVRNGKIMKIGGTRVSMKERFGSYLCGHHVPQRDKSGKMSVTNAYLYHTIEADLLENDDSKWEIYTFPIPPQEITLEFMGKEMRIKAQIYHGLESHAIEEYRKLAGCNPQFSVNSDPAYRQLIKKMNKEQLIIECETMGLYPYQSITYKGGVNKGKARPMTIPQLVMMLTTE